MSSGKYVNDIFVIAAWSLAVLPRTLQLMQTCFKQVYKPRMAYA